MADFSERIASLNTQMRFKRFKEALPIAYKLRLDLQISQQTEKVQHWLKSTEEVIDQLERMKVSKVTQFFKRLGRSLQEAFDPSMAQEEPARSTDSEDEDEDDEGQEDEEEGESETQDGEEQS